MTGLILSAVVTLDSIEIYNTHELFGSKPVVYFNCKGENKIFLPDVKDANVLYSFKGQESWQVRISFNHVAFIIYLLIRFWRKWKTHERYQHLMSNF